MTMLSLIVNMLCEQHIGNMKEKLATVYGKAEVEKMLEDSTVKGTNPHMFEYRLYGISSHSGSIYGGHYIAHVRHGVKWYYASDSYTNPESLEHALGDEAYVLFYERIWK